MNALAREYREAAAIAGDDRRGLRARRWSQNDQRGLPHPGVVEVATGGHLNGGELVAGGR